MKALWLVCCLACASPAVAQSKPAKQSKPVTDPSAAMSQAVKSNATYEELYQRYLVSARVTDTAPGASIAWMTGLMGDRRARRINDLVTVNIVESVSASGTADANLVKNGTGTAGVGGLAGLDTKIPSPFDLTNLVTATSATKYNGGGVTDRSGELSAVMTTRVTEVLGNGDLVLEGVREIAINGDRQMIVLTGVVRPSDILPNNTVLSTRLGQMSVRYFGNGLMKDSLKPGIIIRLLNKIF
jgi:flagellar L-ring protein precursor FlgH